MDGEMAIWCARLVPARRLREIWAGTGTIEAALDRIAELRTSRSDASWANVRGAIAGRVEREARRAEEALSRLADRGPVAVLRTDEHAGVAATATESPWVVVLGSPPSAGAPRLAIVGTRDVDVGQVGTLEGFVERLIDPLEVEVVSGGARGIDTIAHRSGLALGRRVTVVIAGGLLHAGPRENAADFDRVIGQGGCLLSDAPPHVAPERFEFLHRNRHIAALGRAVVVVRAGHRSGALSTARHAVSLGRPVFAVPGAPWDGRAEGCNRLIAEGLARSCVGAESLAGIVPVRAGRVAARGEEEAGGVNAVRSASSPGRGDARSAEARRPADVGVPAIEEAPPSGVSEGALAIWRAVADGPRSIDELAGATRLGALELHGAVLELELAGAIDALPGARFGRGSPTRRGDGRDVARGASRMR